MPLTIAQATRRARQGRSGLGGLCLAFSRWCYGIPAKHPSADADWKNAKYKVVQSHTRGMPVGAFIHMYSPRSTYQHIGIYMGGGLFATTDSGRSRTYVGTVSSWQRAGYSIRGWAADCNGVTVPELKKVYDRVKGKTSTGKSSSGWHLPTGVNYAVNDRTSRTRSGVNAADRASIKKIQAKVGVTQDGRYGPKTRAAVIKKQKALKIKADGLVGPTTWKALGL